MKFIFFIKTLYIYEFKDLIFRKKYQGCLKIFLYLQDAISRSNDPWNMRRSSVETIGVAKGAAISKIMFSQEEESADFVGGKLLT